MFRNYFIIAIRQLAKQKMYSFVKIGGFALSIAACLLIALYIKDELSYDRAYPTTDRIYRITGEYNNNGKIETGADWPPPMAKALKQDFPEVEKSGRLMPHPLFYCAGSNQVRSVENDQNVYEEGFTYADPEMLDILKVPMVYGDRNHALADPNSIVLSKRKADKFFPNQNPLGKLLILNNDPKRIYKVGGVMENFPSTSHIQYDFWLTMTGYELWNGEQTGWGSSNYYTYVLLKPGASPQKFESKLKLILTKYYLPMLLAAGDKSADNFTKKAKLKAQSIKDVHLYSYNLDDGLAKGDIRFVWLFGAIACFILIIACINFINLATAKSANRAKEVGLRKVVGSQRFSLIKQFLTESLLYSVCSFILGILLAALALPYFNQLFGKSLVVPWASWWLVPVIISSAIVVGILAGIYPSFYLSSFRPINVLKGQLSRGSKNSLLRNGLVVFQFSTSVLLVVCTLVIARQTHYMLNKKIGFDKSQVLLLQGTNTLDDKTQAFKNELLRSSTIQSVTVSDFLPIAGTKRNGNTFYQEGRTKEDIGVGAQNWTVDYDYVSTLGMKLVQGRNFSKDMAGDSAATIINQTMAQKLGLKNPVGQRITNGWAVLTVIGVLEDFNYETMKQSVDPLCLVLGGGSSTILAVKIKSTDAKATLSYIEPIWKKFEPKQPIRYTFLDETFANMYADVYRTGNIFTIFAGLAIAIACLGLFALSAFMAEQRNKEISIRKVLGASVSGITTMLSKDFMKLVLISILIASPIAWWAMTKWLQDFDAPSRIQISWWMFALAGIVALLIALITISFQSIRAALASPAKSLRSQ